MKRQQIRNAFLLPLLGMFAIALAVQIALFLFPFAVFETWDERGRFGDSFGFVSAMFSGFALCGVIYSLAFQLRDQARRRRTEEKSTATTIGAIGRLTDSIDAQTAMLDELVKQLRKQ